MKFNAPEATALCYRNEKATDNAFSLQLLTIAPGDLWRGPRSTLPLTFGEGRKAQ